jgi:hypothetical protein
MLDRDIKVCFKCGDVGIIAVENNPRETLGLCPCYEGYYVGTVLQLVDYLNDAHSQLEEMGLLEKALEEYNPDDEDLEDLINGEV